MAFKTFLLIEVIIHSTTRYQPVFGTDELNKNQCNILILLFCNTIMQLTAFNDYKTAESEYNFMILF